MAEVSMAKRVNDERRRLGFRDSDLVPGLDTRIAAAIQKADAYAAERQRMLETSGNLIPTENV